MTWSKRVLAYLALVPLLVAALGLRQPTGRSVVHTVALREQPLNLVVDPRSGHAFVSALNSAGISMLDIASGRIHTILLARSFAHTYVASMVVDQQTERLFVLMRHSQGTRATRDLVIVLDARRGSTLNTCLLPAGGIATQLGLDKAANRVFVVTSPLPILAIPGTAWLSVIDGVNGQLARTLTIGQKALTSSKHPRPGPSLLIDQSSQHVFVADNQRGLLSQLDGGSGSALWTATFSAITRAAHTWTVASLVVDEHTNHLFVANPLVGTISTLALQSGRLLQTARVGIGPLTLDIDERAGRIFAFHKGVVSVLDATSGLLLHTTDKVGQDPTRTPLLVERTGGHVFITNVDGTIHMLDVMDGHLLRTVTVEQNVVFAVVDRPTGHIFVASVGALAPTGSLMTRGIISVLDGRSGIILRRVRVGIGPGLVAMDEQTGQGIVLNYGSSSVSIVDGSR